MDGWMDGMIYICSDRLSDYRIVYHWIVRFKDYYRGFINSLSCPRLVISYFIPSSHTDDDGMKLLW